MTLAEATASFLLHLSRSGSTIQPQLQSPIAERTLQLLTSYFSPTVAPREITSEGLRDFLARWYVDAACGSRPDGSDQLPTPGDLLNALMEFFKWVDNERRADVYGRCFPILKELSSTLPRAFEITNTLSRWLQERGGAFSFPEFLTSFEEGGRSQYDIDQPDEDDGALDGYFQIIRAEGSSVEAEEVISGKQVWPIVFPVHVAALLAPGYTINLEVVRTREGWQITGCGFAYPPGTDV
jgi:hypothetical protein